VDNNTISGSELLNMAFNKDIGDITLLAQKLSTGDVATWTAYNNGVAVASGSFTPPPGYGEDDTISFNLTDSLTSGTLSGGFDKIALGSSSGDYRLLSMSVQESLTPDDQLFSFNVTGTDTDGDSATSVLYVNINGDPAVGGTSGDDSLSLGSSGVLIGGDGDDSLTGSAGSDSLFGGSGTDTLRGGDGNDVLVGGSGADTLYGGLGADTFVWHLADAPSAVTDTVKDFSTGDKLDIAELLSGDATVDVAFGTNTTIHVSGTGVDQTIVLENYATTTAEADAIKAMLQNTGSFTG
jgi:Ca2+-binding RTX toxin-like protein